jgi:hypothetical protein
MANVLPMTVQDISDDIHVAYEQATDTPALTDDDGLMRLKLINKGIRRWQYENSVRWKELDVLNAAGAVIVAGQIVYPITQSDFRELGSKIRIINLDGSKTIVDIVDSEYYRNYMNGTGLVQGYNPPRVAAISGNPSLGYSINLGWVPMATDNNIGGTIYFDYYKFAKKMALMTDIPEMSNPNFLVSYSTAELFVNDDVNLYTKFNGDALNDLSNMRDENDAAPPFASNSIENQGSADSIVMGC